MFATGSLKIFKGSMAFLFIYVFWGFILSETIFESSSLLYLTLAIIFVSFSILLMIGGRNYYSNEVVLWAPFLIWYILGFAQLGNFQLVLNWYVPLVILLISRKFSISNNFPYKLLFYTGIMVLVGIIFQLFFPSVYNTFVLPLFAFNRAELFEAWASSNYGFSGFMSQLDRAAMPMIFVAGMLLFCPEKALPHMYLSKKYVRYILLSLFFIGVFITGKRMAMIIVCVAPFLVYFLKSNKNEIGYLVVYLLLASVAYGLFMNNLDFFSDLPGFSRVVDSMSAYESGDDITSKRSEINEILLSQFSSHPILGIGVGQIHERFHVDSHNVYFLVLAEQGLIGFSIFITPLIICIARTIKCLRKRSAKKYNGILSFSLFCQFVMMLYFMTENADLFVYIFTFCAIGMLVNIKSLLHNYRYENVRSNQALSL